MRSALIVFLAFCVLFGSAAPAWASEGETDPSIAQVPDIRPFRSAHFEMAGTLKMDGVTIDIIGDGDLSVPDRQQAAYKFGPFTVEVIVIGDAVYTRSRFNRTWSREIVPQPIAIGPISAGETARLERDVRMVGESVVGDVLTQQYTAELDFQRVVEPLLGTITDADIRRALRTLRGSVDVWVGVEDRMIRQERLIVSMTLPALEPGGDPADATIDLTLAYFRLNEPVDIEAPPRNDPRPVRTPRPSLTPQTGAPGTTTSPGVQPRPGQPPAQAPARAPAQVPRR